MSHTPKPWDVYEDQRADEPTFAVYSSSASGPDAPATVCVVGVRDDAWMIAAAPELLDACRAVLMFYDCQQWTAAKGERWAELTGNPDCTTKALCDFVRKAIAKAEGETP